ncbi:glycosyltransferase family 4 protein [candidate division WOR-3 bacterium]|nr:glycosyltransferase family 4 protein [candidate division WOR-3 bacterium]
MRILVVNWRCIKNPLAGGAEIYFQEVFKRLVRRGHAVTLLAERFAGSEPEETLDGIRTIRMGGKWTFNFTAGRHVGRLADALDADVVVDDLNKIPFCSPWHTRRPVLALLMHLFRGSIFRETLPPMAAYVWLTESMIPWAYKSCLFAVLSESSKRDTVGLGIPARQITVIPPGTDLDRFRSDLSAPRSLDPSPVVLHVGRLKKYKSTDHLLKAARMLKDKGRSFRVVVVGTGDDLERLRKLSSRLQLGDTVEFTGFVPEDEKLGWYRRAAVLVENSVKEGWGLIVMEANGCGTPAVVARSPGLVDSSRDGENGLMYDYGDVSGLAEKLDQLLTDEPLRHRLGRQAIVWARQWTWDGAADAMEQVIAGAVAGTRSSA